MERNQIKCICGRQTCQQSVVVTVPQSDTQRLLDSPTQIQLSFGRDGQIQTDHVAVGVVFVGAVEINKRVLKHYTDKSGLTVVYVQLILRRIPLPSGLPSVSSVVSTLMLNSGHVVWDRLLSGVPLGGLSSSVSAVSFIKPQTVTGWGQTELVYIPQKGRQTALCEFACVTQREGVYVCGWVCHLWIWSSKLIFGPASSSLWTENLKPTDSWAGVRKVYKKHMIRNNK